ncbi:APC family permease [Emticicia sp. 17c]|uniref:APC family permease n=1 Tax=Emticicia sp. 17c TaxID=3127704 RepID=UPI00301CB123
MANFKKEIRLYDAVMLVSGSMIGSGIFIVSSDVAKEVGASGWLLVSWIIAGVLTMVGALCYGELTAMFPHAGGQYVFLQKAYGRLTGFLYGWSFFAVIQTGTIAAVAVAFATYSGVLFPDYISDKHEFFSIGDTSFKLTSQRLLAIASIIILTYSNTRGVKEGKIIQNIFSTTKLIAIALLIILGFILGSNADVISQNFSNMFDASSTKEINGQWVTTAIGGFGIILALGVTQVGTLFSSDSWNGLTFAGDEVVEPKKTIPRGLAIGTLVVTVLYLLMNVAYLCILPLKGDPNGTDVLSRGIQFASEKRVAAAAATLIGGQGFSIVVALMIMVSTFGCNNGLILSGSRVYYTMAKDGLFFKNFGKLSENGVPKNALWWQCLWACFLCLTGKYGDLLDYLMNVVILFYAFTIYGIFILRRKMPEAERPIKAPGYPIIPMLYVIATSVIVLILIKEKPEFTLPGLIIVAIGVPVYLWFNKKK